MSKTLSFACVHFTVAFSVGWALSGDWRVGGALALVEPLCNTVAFHFHEKLWQTRQRHAKAGTTTDKPSCPVACPRQHTCLQIHC